MNFYAEPIGQFIDQITEGYGAIWKINTEENVEIMISNCDRKRIYFFDNYQELKCDK